MSFPTLPSFKFALGSERTWLIIERLLGTLVRDDEGSRVMMCDVCVDLLHMLSLRFVFSGSLSSVGGLSVLNDFQV